MSHVDLGLGGPVWVFVQLILVLAVVLSVFVVVDSIRRARKAGERYQDRMLKFGVFQVVFLLVLLLAQFAVLNPWLPITVVGLIPFSLIQSVSYLLRVVYPKPDEDAADVARVDEAEPSR